MLNVNLSDILSVYWRFTKGQLNVNDMSKLFLIVNCCSIFVPISQKKLMNSYYNIPNTIDVYFTFPFHIESSFNFESGDKNKRLLMQGEQW